MKHRLLVIFVTLLFPIVSSADLYIAINDNYDLEFSIDGNPIDCKAVVKGVKDGETLTRLSTIPQKMKFKHYVVQNIYLIGDVPYYLKDTIECSVIGIADEAFKGNTDLQTVNIPNHVKTLGKGVFANCTNLRSVEMSNRIDIPDNFFEGCVNLESFSRLALSNSFTTIGTRAFKNCKKLSTNIILSNDLEYVGKEAFYGCESVKTIEVSCSKDAVFIDEDAFGGCTGINKVNCTNLSAWLKITFSNPAANPLSYGHKLYIGNNLASTLVIPDFATKIPAYSFYGCTSLSSVIMNHTNKHIEECGEKAFYGCVNLNRVTIPKIAFWCDIVFADKYSNPLYYAHHIWEPPSATHANGREIDRLEIPHSVKRINAYAFYGANALERIDIGGGVRRIGEEAFADCVPQEINSYIIVPFTIPYNVFSPLAYANSVLIVPNRTFSSGSCSLDKYKNTPSWCYFQNIETTGQGIIIYNISNTLTITAKGYGTITYKNTEIVNETKSFPLYYNVFSGIDLIMAVKPDQGYEMGQILVDGEMLQDRLYEDTITIEGVVGDVNISVEFIRSEEPIYSSSNNSTICYQELRYALNYESGTAVVLGVSEASESTITIPAQLTLTEKDLEGSNSRSSDGRIPSMSGTSEMFVCSRVFKDAEMKTSDISSVYSVFQSNNRPLNYVVKVIGNDAFKNNAAISKVVIGDGVSTICRNAFNGCKNLQQITLPNTLRFIGSQAFRDCSDLTSINIPYFVTKIGDAAFRNCSNLTNIYIGMGIKSIGIDAFVNCKKLTDVYCYALSVPTTESDAFEKSFVKYATLHVPAASVDLYKAQAPWKDFGNIVSIQPDDEIPHDEVTLTANSYSRAYGEANPTFGYTVTEGSIASGTPTISCEATATSPVGTYDIVIAKGSVSNNTVSLVKGTLTITKAPLTVSAGNYTKVEGEDNPVFAPTYSGFKNGETAAVLTKQPVITTTATKTSTAGTYPVTVSGAEAQNYSFNYQNGTLTVTSQSVVQKDNIQFADAKVKAICVANWDTDHDGELSKQEAAAVTSIGEVFSWKSEITSFDELQYFTGLTAIDDNAFAGCDGLTSITLPNTVTSLGAYAFSGCDGLTSFVIPSSVTTLNDAVFNYCVGLTSIIIPKSVTRMGFNPLNGCSALTSIQVESGNPNFDSRNGCNAIIYGKSGILVSGCKNTVIPDGIKTIWQYAFGGCEELTSITIPASVTTFGDYAFFGCDNLEEIHSEIVQPSAINATVFGNTDIFTTATLYVPAGTKAQYQATDGWKDFRNIVEQGGTATDIASATITIENTSYPYTGSAIEPAVSVVYSGTTLVKGTDYSLSYKNNIMAGTATVTATGVGNYTGTVTATFTINKALLTVTAEDKSKVYGEAMPELTCQIIGFVNNEDAMMLTTLPFIATTASTMSPVGTYDITVSGGEARNYSFNYEAGTLTIVPKGIATATLTVADSCVYTGQPIRPDVTVQLDGRVLTEGTDYILTFTNNFMPGIASLTIMGAGNYTGTVTKTFVIFAPTAIGDVDADATKFDVYDMSGRKIRRHVTNIEGLPKGVYIIGGRKRAVK